MSKVVKKVGGAVKKIVKHNVNIIKKTFKEAKRFAKSKVGKIIIGAALIYFGGAALMGALGGASGAAAGSGFFGTLSSAASGASAGLSSAWGGITSGTLSGAASGFTGAYSAGASAASGAAAAAGSGGIIANGMTQGQMLAAQNAGISGATQATNTALASGAAGAGGAGAGGAAAGLTTGQGMAISSGVTLAGNLIQGHGASKAAKEQAEAEARAAEAERARYNTNVGTSLWGDQSYSGGEGGGAGTGGTGVAGGGSGVTGGPALLSDRWTKPGQGLVARGMQGNPSYGGGMPVYNPYYFNS